MPPRRRLRARRTARPRLMRRKYGRRRVYRRRGRIQAVHTFKRGLLGLRGLTPGAYTTLNNASVWSTSGKIIGNAVNAPVVAVFSLAGLSNVINVSEFQNLFDQYRIEKCMLKFYLKVDPGAQAAASATIPRLYSYRDKDDQTVPTDLNEFKENQYCREQVMSLYRPCTLVCRPNVLQTITGGSNRPVKAPFLDIGTTTTPHYCWKVAIDDLTNTNYFVDVEATLWFTCKQSR